MDELTSIERENIRHDWDKEDYREYRRKVIRESQRRRRQKAKEQGLCGICARRPVTKGYLTCEECYSRVRIWQAKHKESNNG